MNKEKVMVAMSGGVDSTVCAHLIKESGYKAEAVTMKLWSDNENIIDETETTPDRNCMDAKKAAVQLNIPHYSIALGESFKKTVIDRFISDYVNGATPNPCVECNKHIKFGALMSFAMAHDCYYLATGHYARKTVLDSGEHVIMKAVDISKDQSYFLWAINKELLPHILFPLGDYSKQDVRKIAEEYSFECAHRSDSQDICFIPTGDYISFIKGYTNREFPQGNFISPDGRVLGKHSGIINYTIGQRKGLGIVLGEPAYVCKKCALDNTVTLGTPDDLYSKELTAHSINIQYENALKKKDRFTVKIRYRHEPTPATVLLTDANRLHVIFDEPQRAVTAGQSVVIYDGDILVGGGIID